MAATESSIPPVPEHPEVDVEHVVRTLLLQANTTTG